MRASGKEVGNARVRQGEADPAGKEAKQDGMRGSVP